MAAYWRRIDSYLVQTFSNNTVWIWFQGTEAEGTVGGMHFSDDSPPSARRRPDGSIWVVEPRARFPEFHAILLHEEPVYVFINSALEDAAEGIGGLMTGKEPVGEEELNTAVAFVTIVL